MPVDDRQSRSRATDLGMNFIHQELAFVPGMTVLENIMLGAAEEDALRHGRLEGDRPRCRADRPARRHHRAAESPNVKDLSTAENWLINICRALMRKARLIVMDEPTASLSATESEKLFTIIEDLSQFRRRDPLRLAPAR